MMAENRKEICARSTGIHHSALNRDRSKKGGISRGLKGCVLWSEDFALCTLYFTWEYFALHLFLETRSSEHAQNYSTLAVRRSL